MSVLASGCATNPATDTVVPTGADIPTSGTPLTTLASTTSTPPTTTSTVAGEALSGRRTLEVDGRSRAYEIFVPPGHDVRQPTPLVIVAHGGRGSISQVRRSGFDVLAAEKGIVVLYPEGVDGIWDFNDGEEMDREDVNDVEFVSALIEEVASVVAIDRRRVYAIGFSQGFGLAALLACHRPDQIVAVVSVAGLVHHDGAACQEPQPARVLAIAGLADPITTAGSPDLPFADPPRPFVEEIDSWIATNKCDPTPDELALSEDVSRHHYSCAGDAALVSYLHPGGHAWPSEMGPGIETNRVIWEFLSQFVGAIP